MGFQQVVQPSGRRAFLKSDLQVSAQPVDKLQDHAGFGFDDRFHHYLAGRIPDSNRNAFLVNVHADIFSTDHKGRPPLERLSEALKPYSTRGALLNCVGKPESWELAVLRGRRTCTCSEPHANRAKLRSV